MIIQAGAIDHNAGLAAVERITGLFTIAEKRVIAQAVRGRIRAGIIGFVACIDRAGDTVITGIGAQLANTNQARFQTVAEAPVAAGVAVVGRGYTSGSHNAGVIRTRIEIITKSIVRCIHACIADFVTAIGRTGNTVVAMGCRSRLATVYRITGFGAVAELTVVAGGVIRCVRATVTDLVARINRADYAVVTVRCRSRLTTKARITRFRSVAVLTIVTIDGRTTARSRRITKITGGTSV